MWGLNLEVGVLAVYFFKFMKKFEFCNVRTAKGRLFYENHHLLITLALVPGTIDQALGLMELLRCLAQTFGVRDFSSQ